MTDLGLPHLTRVPLFVKKDKPLHPTNVSFFRSEAIVPGKKKRAYLIEEFWLLFSRGILAERRHNDHLWIFIAKLVITYQICNVQIKMSRNF